MQRSEARRWGRVKPLRSGQMLRSARESRHISQKDLAAKVEISVAQLSDIERGIETLSLKRARQLATVLEIPFPEVLSQVLQDRLNEAGFSDLRVTVTPAVDEIE
jgi:transcriptional regulator with XRE-family HTH domain